MRIRFTKEEFEKLKALVPERVVDDLSSVYEKKKAREKIFKHIAREMKEEKDLDIDLEIIPQLESKVTEALENDSGDREKQENLRE